MSLERNSIALAIAWPCVGPNNRVRRIKRSRVPCSNSMRSFCPLVDILLQNSEVHLECQGESARSIFWRNGPKTASRCVRKIDLHESARDRHNGLVGGDNITFDMTKSV